MEDKYSEINYEAAREEYLERLIKNPGVDSVIEFGQINAPGLSDIDWLVILDTNKILNSKFLLLDDVVSMNTKNAFQHRPIFYPKIFAYILKILRLLPYFLLLPILKSMLKKYRMRK